MRKGGFLIELEITSFGVCWCMIFISVVQRVHGFHVELFSRILQLLCDLLTLFCQALLVHLFDAQQISMRKKHEKSEQHSRDEQFAFLILILCFCSFSLEIDMPKMFIYFHAKTLKTFAFIFHVDSSFILFRVKMTTIFVNNKYEYPSKSRLENLSKLLQQSANQDSF